MGIVIIIVGAFLLSQGELIREKVLSMIKEQVENMEEVMSDPSILEEKNNSPVLNIMNSIYEAGDQAIKNARQIMALGGGLIVLAFIIGEPRTRREPPDKTNTAMTEKDTKQFLPVIGERTLRRIDLPDRTYIITDHRIIFRPENEEVKVKDIIELTTGFNIYTGYGDVYVTDVLGDTRELKKIADVRTINNIIVDLMARKLEVGGIVRGGEQGSPL